MKKVDDPYVQHILGAIAKLNSFFLGCTYDSFLLDQKLQDAAVLELEIIGEAAKRISVETKKKYPDVPWKDIMGMRDKLVHDYFDVNYLTVWETVQNNLTSLREHMERILQDLQKIGS